MQIALALDEFVATDIELSLRFASKPITLDDVAALIAFSKDLLAGIQEEIALETGDSIEFLPEVIVSRGSFKLSLKLKSSKWDLKIRAKVTKVFLAAVLYAFPAASGQEVHPTSVAPPSDACVQMIETALAKANESWQYFGKGFESDIEIRCGDRSARYSIKNPPPKK